MGHAIGKQAMGCDGAMCVGSEQNTISPGLTAKPGDRLQDSKDTPKMVAQFVLH